MTARGPLSQKLEPFGTTIFAEMSGLAVEHNAINLSQGFPDFDGPVEVIDAAVAALRAGHNQYARSMGVPPLVKQIVEHRRRFYDLEYDPLREVTVTCGATEGIAAALMGMLDPGDEVVFFEPFYDSYPACAAMAGAVPRYCTLRFEPATAEEPGKFTFDLEQLAELCHDGTRLLVLNTPHNPTGKVFSREELEGIAAICRRHDILVLADEVYEHLTFDGAEHVPIATLEGMRDRTLTLSSAGKTFSFTGWKIGWATGPASMVAAAQSAHQFMTYSVATPFQHAVAKALEILLDGVDAAGAPRPGGYLDDFRRSYAERRDFLERALTSAGFQPARTVGTYFILAGFAGLSTDDDRTFAKQLVVERGVAAIPPSVFYAEDVDAGRALLRFAFCKQLSTLEAAAKRLMAKS